MDFVTNLFSGFLSGIGPFFLLLGLLIFIHEMGHFLVARYFGVRVETFSIGFGKKILKWRRGETDYCVSIIPLGGYVKMFGDDPTKELPPEDRDKAFLYKPIGQRIWIVLAGPLMNLFFAMLLFSTIGFFGEKVPSAQIGDVAEGTAAYTAGFRSGDKILSVDDHTVSTWKEMKDLVEAKPNQTLNFQVERELTGLTDSINADTILQANPFIFSTQKQVGWIDGLDIDSKSPMIAVEAGSPAATSGLKTFDLITSVNGVEVKNWRGLQHLLQTQTAPLLLKVKNYKDDTKKTDIAERELSLTKNDLKGIQEPDLVIFAVKRGSPADTAGLKVGDLLKSVNGQAIKQWEELLATVKNFDPEKSPTLEFTVERLINNKLETKNLSIAPELTEIPTATGGMDKRYAIGISPTIASVGNALVLTRVSGPLNIFWHGIEKSYDWSKLIAISMLRLVEGQVSAKNIGGVISIGRVASQSYDLGWIQFIKMMAIISINLFILNLLPVPVLDGGHLVFFTIEAIKGSPLSLKKIEIAQQVGMVLLLALMVFALFNDVTHLLSGW